LTAVPDTASSLRTIVLVGFMGAGKTTVGRALADRIGWRFVDADDEAERRAGRTIAEMFASEGEPAFRALEQAVMHDLVLEPDACVIATGGGWAAEPSRVRDLPPTARAVWLHVSPEVAVRRASGEGRSRSSPVRPLMEVDDPLEMARSLLAAREPGYAAAGTRIETDGREPGDIVGEILHELAVDFAR
jgi:shikimate kinase